MHLQRSPDGATWTPVTDLLTDASGAAAATDHPVTNSFYRLVFDGSPDLTASTSPVVRVLVRSVVQLRPDSRGATRVVRRGSTVTFSARVQPAPGPAAPGSAAPARVTYRLYQLVGRSWVVKRTWAVSLDASGSAGLAMTFGSRGSWRVRAYAPGTSTNAISALSPAQPYSVR